MRENDIYIIFPAFNPNKTRLFVSLTTCIFFEMKKPAENFLNRLRYLKKYE